MNTDKKLRKIYWGRFYDLAGELLKTLSDFLTVPEDAPHSKMIFKLNFNRYEDTELGEKIVGVKRFDDDIYMLVQDSDGIQAWELAEGDRVEYPDSVTRIDILMWMVDEMEFNQGNLNLWIQDTTNFTPQPIYEEKEH